MTETREQMEQHMLNLLRWNWGSITSRDVPKIKAMSNRKLAESIRSQQMYKEMTEKAEAERIRRMRA